MSIIMSAEKSESCIEIKNITLTLIILPQKIMHIFSAYMQYLIITKMADQTLYIIIQNRKGNEINSSTQLGIITEFG